MHPLTDIVVLCHNRLDITKRFIEYLFLNTKDFKLIFIDNASTDNTYDFLQNGQEEKKWKVVKSPINLGVAKGRNLGLHHSNGDYIIHLDNDQFVLKEWLEKLFTIIEQGYDMAGAEGWLLFPPNTPGVVSLGKFLVSDRGYFPCRRCTQPSDKYTYLGGGGTLIKREVYERIGNYDERFAPFFYEDPDLSFRAIQAGFKLGWCYDCPINHQFAHQTCDHQKLFNKSEQFFKSWMEFRKKWNGYYPEPMQMP